MRTTLLYLLAALILSFFAVAPLFTQGFFPMHDDTQVSRVYEMGRSLMTGQFPVRLVQDLGYGYGYPIFNFYAPLAYYIGSLPLFFGVDALLATKWMFIFGTLLAGVTMFFLGRALRGNTAGLISALLYMYAPYHGVNIYVRGAVAEFFAYAFLPLIFFSLYQVSKTKNRWYILLGGMSFAGVVLSHNLTALMITPFVLLYCGYLYYYTTEKQELLKQVGMTLLLGVSLSAFYWLPVLTEMQHTNVRSQIEGTGSKFQDHFVCLMQLWNSPWGYGGSIQGCVDGMSFQIGKLHILFFLFSALFLLIRKNKETLFYLGVGGIALFFLLPYSSFLWQIVKPMEFFQFPWRFLLLISFVFSLIGGVGIAGMLEKNKNQYLEIGVVGVVILLIILFNKRYFVPQTISPKSVEKYISEENLKWKISKISDEYLPKNFAKPQNKEGVVSEKLTSSSQTIHFHSEGENAVRQEYVVIGKKGDVLHFNTAYFPGWKLFVDGKEKHYTVVPNGLEYTLEESGNKRVILQYMQTPWQIVGNTVSLIGVLGSIAGIIYLTYGKSKKNS